jgi:hypothetical protein
LPTGLPLTRHLPSIPSAADRSTLFGDFLGTMRLSDFSGSYIIGYDLFGLPDADRAARGRAGQAGDLPGSDAILSCVMWSSTTAERRPLAYRCRTCCLRRCLPPRPLRLSSFRGSIAHPTGSLCTLRSRRHRRPRNTRYRAPATAYPCRSSTGWIAPAVLAHKQSRGYGLRRESGQRGSSRMVVGKVSGRTISCAWVLR